MYANDTDSIFPAKCNTTCIYRGNMETMWSHHVWGLPLKHRACYILFHFDMTFLKKVRFLPGWVEKKHPQSHPPHDEHILYAKLKNPATNLYSCVFCPATTGQVHHAIAKTLPQHRFRGLGPQKIICMVVFPSNHSQKGGLLHPWKLTWHWKITIFNRKYIFKWRIFHCHVGFRGVHVCRKF